MIRSMLPLALILAACGGATVPGAEEAPASSSPPATSPAPRDLFVCADRPELAPAFACLEASCSTRGPGDVAGELTDGEACVLERCAEPLKALEEASGPCYWCAVVEVLDGHTFAAASAFCGG